jgi:hypothetical protein
VKTVLIRIDDADGGGYPVRLFVDDGREDWLEKPQATSTIPTPLPVPEAPELVSADAIRELILSQDSQSDAFELGGAFLHDLLASGEVGRAWSTLRDGGDGVRLLLDVRAPALRQLPWELMRRDSPLPLFVDEQNPCARMHELRIAAATVECSPVLRVLVVLGVEEDDVETQAGLELEGLRDGFRTLWGLLDLEILDRPTQKKLEETYASFQPHILHFIGHGEATDGGGQLAFDGHEGEDGWAWSATAIAAALAGWRPRLAFVNACRSGERTSVRGAWQIADALLDADVPAVLAMQGDIRGDAAAAFTGALYDALAHDRPLDVAVVAGRRAISHNADWRRRDPWLPCLWLGVPADRVLPQRYAITPQQRAQLEQKRPFAMVKRFVNRAPERRRLWRGLNGGEAARQIGAAVAVVGPPTVGKSGLVRWAIGSSALRGANVAYVDLHHERKLSFVQALAAVQKELCASPVHGAANKAAFAEFSAATTRLAGGAENAPEDAVDTVFDAFAAALRSAAGESSIVLALDHVHGVEPAHWRFILEQLVDPIAAGGLPVQLILVHRKDDENAAVSDTATIDSIPLDRLPVGEYRELASLYLRAQGFKREQFATVVEAFAVSVVRDAWDGGVFDLLDTAARYGGWPREDG